METAHYLREQGALLRGIARTFDIRGISDRLLALAEECDQLARLVESNLTKGKAGRPSARLRARSRTQRRTRAA